MVDIGQAFYEFQKVGVALVNDSGARASMDNLACFMAANYIWDTSVRMKLPVHIHERIKTTLTLSAFEFSDELNVLLCNLETLVDGNILQEAPKDEALSENITIFKQLYDMAKVWSNEAADGSRERRKNDGKEGLRPDLQVFINKQAVLEVKPASNMTEPTYLSDKWKVVHLAKDELDLSLKKHIRLPYTVAIQVFGHKMEVCTIRQQCGIHVLYRHLQVYVRGRDDGGSLRACLRALFSVKAWMRLV
ncbi:hypothetical protein BGX34_004045 [Mortierella sp. NVP85]|nr:hypothetical protein BGX34_004045 [Mortierella sp. NVP85]